MIPRLILAGLITTSEQVINSGIRVAAIKPEQLAPMTGKVLRLCIKDLNIDTWVICGDTKWWLANEPQDYADIELSGTLGSFIEIAHSITQPNKPLIFEGLDIRGNVGVLQTMQTMFKGINLDWEDIVTKVLGPLPAGILLQTLRKLRSQWLISRDSLKQQAEEFIQSEQELLLTNVCYKDSETRISKLTRRLDRLDARFKRLETNRG